MLEGVILRSCAEWSQAGHGVPNRWTTTLASEPAIADRAFRGDAAPAMRHRPGVVLVSLASDVTR